MGDIIVQTDRGCPKCGTSEVVLGKDQQLTCSRCGSVVGSVIHLCPSCSHYNDNGRRNCSVCGTELVRACTSCGADNWILATYCGQCGRHLGIVERLARRWQQTTQQRLYEHHASMSSLKEREEWASQIRMAAITDLERLALERPGDRLPLRILAVIAALLFVAFIVALMVTVGGA